MKKIPLHSAANTSSRSPPRSRPGLRWLLAAPHRLFFFMGTSLLILAMTLWALNVVARYLPVVLSGIQVPFLPLGADAPTGWVHALGLLGGSLAAYVFGFVFTALPRWQSRPPMPASAVLPGAVLHFVGAGLLIAGLAMWGLPLLLASWIVLIHLAVRHILVGPHADKRHATLVLGCIVLGAAGLLAGVVGVWTQSSPWMRAALWAVLWGMLFPVHMAVSHRMLPFFTANAVSNAPPWRPHVPLYAIIVGAMIYGAAVELRWHLAALIAALLCAGITALFAVRWYANGVLSNRLLAMLHISHAWLPIAFLLAAAQQILALRDTHVLGLAPVHALGMGFLLSTVVAMVSRVTLGHSGRHVSADRLTWWIFWMLQTCVLLRILAELLVAWMAAGLVVTVLLVLMTLLAWAIRYLPVYLQPRADDQPG